MALDVAVVLAAMERQPQAYIDRADGSEARRALYLPVAQVVARVARTPEQAAALLTLGKRETNWARAVIEGHCDRMPAGQRCDGGRARGPWQVHGWCSAGWTPQDGSQEALEGQARCALRLLLAKKTSCRRGWAGAFSGYAGGAAGCVWPPAERRAREMQKVLAFLTQPEPPGAKPPDATPSNQAQASGETGQ